MAIRIGHAAGDEQRRASGGVAGDQTGGEVTLGKWYSSPWDIVLRFKDSAKAEKAAKAMEAACANNKIGYDQWQRNTLNDKAKAVGYDLSKVKDACECDCSSLVSVCAQCAGVDIPYVYGNAPYTGNMRAQFTKTGEFDVLTEDKYLRSDAYLKRGDILLNSKSHTAMVLENGSKAGGSVTTAPTTSKPAEVVMVNISVRQLEKGCIGDDVKSWQSIINGRGFVCGEADGDFGTKTDKATKAFQKANGLDDDGVVGRLTWGAALKK